MECLRASSSHHQVQGPWASGNWSISTRSQAKLFLVSPERREVEDIQSFFHILGSKPSKFSWHPNHLLSLKLEKKDTKKGLGGSGMYIVRDYECPSAHAWWVHQQIVILVPALASAHTVSSRWKIPLGQIEMDIIFVEKGNWDNEKSELPVVFERYSEPAGVRIPDHHILELFLSMQVGSCSWLKGVCGLVLGTDG